MHRVSAQGSLDVKSLYVMSLDIKRQCVYSTSSSTSRDLRLRELPQGSAAPEGEMLAGMMVGYEAERREREVEAMVRERQLTLAAMAARRVAEARSRRRRDRLVPGTADRPVPVARRRADGAIR
jgi:hypothetical protein